MPEGLGSPLIAAVEAGGTKVVCALGSGPDDIRARVRIPTESPDVVFSEMQTFFRSAAEEHGNPKGIGIVTFGPVDLREESRTYGQIMKTPKAGWAGAPWLDALPEVFPNIPQFIDTDVNGSALGERRWGVAQTKKNLVYITVGTGIGGGVVVNGESVRGLLHPEIGHMRIPRDASDSNFAGNCPFHGDCLEGLAAGPSIQKRWGIPAEDIPDDHEAWDFHSDYLAWMCVNLACTLTPEQIILGGGVMQRESVFPKIREKVVERLAGYIDLPEITSQIDEFLTPPDLGQDAGLFGAIALAQAGLMTN